MLLSQISIETAADVAESANVEAKQAWRRRLSAIEARTLSMAVSSIVAVPSGLDSTITTIQFGLHFAGILLAAVQIYAREGQIGLMVGTKMDGWTL